MDVMQRDRARVAFGDGGLQPVAAENEKGGGKTKAATRARCEGKRQNAARKTNRHV